MFGDMMNKLQAMKQEMDTIKARLDTISVMGEAGNGNVRVMMTGNKKVTSISLPDNLQQTDKEELEDLLIIATNKAIENAEKVNEAEMRSAAGSMLPNLKGMM